MKYIIFEKDFAEYPVIFPNEVPHKDISLPEGSKIVGAGFVSLDAINGNVYPSCGGESISLDVVSRKYEDEKLILFFLKRKNT